jgi:hypothetical protein
VRVSERATEREQRTWKREGSILLIRSIFIDMARFIYDTWPRLRSPRSFFRPRLPSPRSSCPGPFVSSTTRHYPRRNARRVHHVLSFTCLASRFRIIFSFAERFSFHAVRNARGIMQRSSNSIISKEHLF